MKPCHPYNLSPSVTCRIAMFGDNHMQWSLSVDCHGTSKVNYDENT